MEFITTKCFYIILIYSFQRCIICKAHSRRPRLTHVTTQTKAIHGILLVIKHVSSHSLPNISSLSLNWQAHGAFTVSEKSKTNTKKENEKTKEEPSSIFQRQRVDMLLGELLRKFPLPMLPPQPQQPAPNQANQATPTQNGTSNDSEQRMDGIKQEPSDSHENNGIKHENDMDIDKSDMKPPPEKKMKMNWFGWMRGHIDGLSLSFINLRSIHFLIYNVMRIENFTIKTDLILTNGLQTSYSRNVRDWILTFKKIYISEVWWEMGWQEISNYLTKSSLLNVINHQNLFEESQLHNNLADKTLNRTL